jgi:membrane fusion protein (multidrug efflux system)
MKQKREFIALVCMALLAGCQSKKTTEEIQPVAVKVMKMAPVQINGAQSYSGTIEEVSGTSLSFSVGGMVKQVLVDEGQRVSKGQLLAVVDDETTRSAHTAALSARQQAEDAYRRMKQLHDNGSLPEIQWVEVESKLRQAVSSEQIARKSLHDTRLYAPFAGVIGQKSIDVGQNAIPGMQTFKLVNINRVKVKISIPESEISKVRMGQTATVSVSALGGRTFEGRVCEKGVSADALSRSYDVKILIDNRGGELMPGMICDASLQKSSTSTVFILPVSVMQLDDDNQQFVWVNVDGKAKKRMVQTASQTNGGVVVTSGLGIGDEVLVEGQQKVSENTSLKVKQ